MGEKKFAGAMALVMIVFAVIMEIYSYKVIPDIEVGVSSFNDNWTIKEENGESVQVTLPVKRQVPAGQELVLENRIPDKFYMNGGIVFRSRQQEVEVYMEEELLYKYPEKELIGQSLPGNWNFVMLPKDCEGKTLTVKIRSPYQKFSGQMGEVYYGNYSELLDFIIKKQTPIFRMGILIGIAGVVIEVLAVILRKYRIYSYQELLGGLLILASVWLCGESQMPLVFLGVEAKYYVTIMALLFLLMFVYGYLYVRWGNIQGKITRRLFYFSGIAGAGTMGLSVAGIWDLMRIMPGILVFAGGTVGYAFWIHLRAFLKKEGRYLGSETVCVGLILAAALVEILFFYSRSNNIAGPFVRLTMLLYALNHFRIDLLETYYGLRERAELEKRLRRSQAELITSQIKPHFIYNTLNSIRALVRIDPETAYNTIYDFSTYLRENLRSLEDVDVIPFSQELKHVKAYVNIEKIRFEERVQVVFDIREQNFQVPPLSVQPLVENAVKHGICKKIQGGTVWIRSYKESGDYVIEVEDNGIGFDSSNVGEKNRQNKSMGLENICFRIQEISGGSMEIFSRPGEGTKVVLRVPEKKTSYYGKGEDGHENNHSR